MYYRLRLGIIRTMNHDFVLFSFPSATRRVLGSLGSIIYDLTDLIGLDHDRNTLTRLIGIFTSWVENWDS